MSLVIISETPVQYQVPIFRKIHDTLGEPVTVIYGKDSGAGNFYDHEFATRIKWDVDLLSGYNHIFLSQKHNENKKNNSTNLKVLLKNLKPKAILLTGYSQGLNILGFFEAISLSCPILFRAETTDTALKRNSVKSFIRDAFLRYFYGKCSRYLYIGINSRNHYKRLGCDESKLFFSPYCVDDALFKLDKDGQKELRLKTRKELGLDNNDIAIIFSGKIVYRKGPDLLLSAVKLLPEYMRSKINLIFLGSGPMQDKMKQRAFTEPRLRVNFLGFKNQTEISQYYCAADLFVLPSRVSETWGLVVNEALHHGLPCVVSESVGSHPDLIKDGINGKVFQTGNEHRLSEAIEEMLSRLKNPELADECRKAVSNYTVERAAEGIVLAYQSLFK